MNRDKDATGVECYDKRMHTKRVIRVFSLFMPRFRDNLALESNAVSVWIFIVSRFGVQDLRREFENMEDHQVPSSLFQCTEFKHLSLGIG